MRLYDNALPSKYEEIKTWYPVWYRDVREMDALWRAFGAHMDDMQLANIRAVNNHFIAKMDAQTVAKLEKALRITYSGPRTLVERRNVLLALWIPNNHIGYREIIELIQVFTAGEIDVTFDSGFIRITITRNFSDPFNMYDTNMILRSRIPAHLELCLTDIMLPVRVVNWNRFRLINFQVQFIFRNRSVWTRKPMLDGVQRLDGTWLLDSTRLGMGMHNIIFSSYRFSTRPRLRARAITDSRWYLDGSWSLDSARTLTADIKEEEL